MPWTKDDVETHIKDLSDKQKDVWVRVANGALARCLDGGGKQEACEGSAIRQANMVAKNIQEGNDVEDANLNEAVKTEDGVEYPASAFLVVPDPDLPSTWKLRIWEDPEKKVTRAQLGRAAATLGPGGFRGQRVDLTPEQRASARSKLRALYHKLDVPDEEIPSQIQEAGILREAVQIIEAVQGTEGREWDVLLIEAGTSKNGNHYPAETLQTAAHLFEGAYAFADHATEAERRARPERSVKDKVGRFGQVAYGAHEVAGRVVEGLKARFKVVAPWLREMLLEAIRLDEPDFLGFSIDAEGSVKKRDYGGKSVNWVERILKVNSVDVVTDPAAGGRVMRLVASNDPTNARGEDDMEKDELERLIRETIGTAVEPLKAELTALKAKPPETDEKAQAVDEAIRELKEARRLADHERRVDVAIGATRLSEEGRKQLRGRLMETVGRRDVADEEVAIAVTQAVDYEAALVQKYAAPSVVARVQMGDSGQDKIVKGLMGLFEGAPVDGIPPFRSLKEAYCRWSGMDYFDLSAVEFANAFHGRYDSQSDHKRITESLTTASWTDVFGDVMYKKLIKDYAADPYNRWRALVSDIDSPGDFMTQHWVRIGGYADLSTVSEQATYPNLTSPGDEEVEYAVAKRGGIDDYTFEMAVNDNLGKVRQIPTKLARSAARTLFKFVLNLLTTDNPTTDYDSVALYIAAHSNTGTNALSLAGVNTSIIAMRDQTAYGDSAEVLGIRNYPKFVIVPNELEQRAKRIFEPSNQYQVSILDSDVAAAVDGWLGMDPGAFAGGKTAVFVYDQLTDADNWFLVADPAQMPTLVIGFLDGRQEPELFIQDQPTVGSVFSADKISIKIRHIYGGDVLEHRGLYRNVV